MKLRGKEIKGVNQRDIIIPRGNNIADAISLRARAIEDWKEFHAVCPQPKPKVKMLPGGKKELDDKHPPYVEAMAKHNGYRMAWIVITSLKASEDLTWDTVDFNKPDTWANFEDELRASGFSGPEIWRIIDQCLEVNALSDDKLDQARADFLSFQREQAALSSSQEEDQVSTPPGEPANALV